MSGAAPSSSSWVCAATSDRGDKKFSNAISQLVLWVVFNVAPTAKKQILCGFRGSSVWEHTSLLPMLIFFNLSECLHDVAKIISLKYQRTNNSWRWLVSSNSSLCRKCPDYSHQLWMSGQTYKQTETLPVQ